MSIESNSNGDLDLSLNHRGMECANIGIGRHCRILSFLTKLNFYFIPIYILKNLHLLF